MSKWYVSGAKLYVSGVVCEKVWDTLDLDAAVLLGAIAVHPYLNAYPYRGPYTTVKNILLQKVYDR